jgi:hypothetical protein
MRMAMGISQPPRVLQCAWSEVAGGQESHDALVQPLRRRLECMHYRRLKNIEENEDGADNQQDS